MILILRVVGVGLLALASGCASPVESDVGSTAGDSGTSETPVADAATADAPHADTFTVVIAGKTVGATLRSCGYQQDATYRSMIITADLADGSKLSIQYMYGYSGGEMYAPRGPVPTDALRLVHIELANPGDDKSSPDKFPMSGQGSINLKSTGQDGIFEGIAEGTFKPGPFDPSPEKTYRIEWWHKK
jgi:hypothetical protein